MFSLSNIYGVLLHKKEIRNKEIKTRIAIATSTLVKLTQIWKNNKITVKTKIRLLRAITYAIIFVWM